VNESELIAQNELKLSKPNVYDKVIKHGMRIVRLEYSYACNFKCEHCCICELQTKPHKRIFTIEDVEELSRQADELGFAQFVISGGEPLVYPEFDEIVNVIDPNKFYITTDSNGWYLNELMAEYLKSIGVDKVQISIDNLRAKIHDKFRRKDGSWNRAIKAVKFSKDAGLNVLIQTVVDKQRVHTKELLDFITFFNEMDIPVFIMYAKPVGAWKGRTDVLVNQDDIDYITSLEKHYHVFTHLTPSYDYQGGCIAMKRMINLTKYGEVNPCPVMQEYSIGNFFNEPLKDIIDRGMVEYGKHEPTCPMALDVDYIKRRLKNEN
jgi:MoaA/NifB/PqqE/SkfB family radical SAM enzyme